MEMLLEGTREGREGTANVLSGRQKRKEFLLIGHLLYFGQYPNNKLFKFMISLFKLVFWVFKKFILFIYLFLAALGLHCCARAFSSRGEGGPLLVAVCGLTAVASLVVEHGLQVRGLQ